LLLLLQSFLIVLQTVNAGLGAFGDIPPWVALVLAAFIGGGQFFVQHVGNGQVPLPPASTPPKS